MAKTKPWSFNEANKYTLYGAIFGACFPVGSITFLYFMGDLGNANTITQIIVQAQTNSLLYVIDTAPFFLGLFARFAGIRQDQLLRFSASLEQQVENKTESLRMALAEAKNANEMIAHMAEHDTLTGLLNRSRFQKELERWTQYGLRYQRPASLLFMDLDKFKAVNDTYGHRAGDQYLTEVSKLLTTSVRSSDILARWGGDEFAVLLPETGRNGAIDVANKLIRAASSMTLTLDGHQINPSFSIGIALFPEHGSSFVDLIVLADAAMYQAKSTGHHSWQLYSASQEETRRVQEHAQWESRIRRALENDQFLLFYQPLLDLHTNSTAGYEALLRMEDPDGQLIGPGLFLESAERFGLAIPIDRMVIRKAARKIEVFGSTAPHISLNLSPQSLQDDHLREYISGVVENVRGTRTRLGFEITESMAVQNIRYARTLSEVLKDLDLPLILDDFSMGTASLRYLREVPITMVKLDGSLIRDLKSNAANQAMVKNLSSLAHDRNITVTAKFVEDPELVPMLRDMGIDYAQGFAIGRPMESMEQIHEMETPKSA